MTQVDSHGGPTGTTTAHTRGKHEAAGHTTTEHATTDHTHGYSEHKAELLKRLRRAEGQVRGIHGMIERDEYCIDVITQVSAATKALERVALALLDDHLGHCVAEAAHEGGEVSAAKLKEASDAIARLVR